MKNFSPEFTDNPSPQPPAQAVARLTLDSGKLAADLDDQLDDLRSKTGHVAPWTWQELDAAYPVGPAKSGNPAADGIAGLTKAKEWKTSSGAKRSIGPIQLRKNSDELAKDLKDAKGLSLGYADNRLVDKPGLWSSEGVLFLPVSFGSDLTTGLSAEWKLAQTNDAKKHDVEEATYSVPIKAYFTPAAPYSALWVVLAKPYYQTDFSGGHQIHGAEVSAEFVGHPFGSPIYLGAFQQISGSNFQYQFRILPKLNQSEVRKEGHHSTRKLGDNWLRLGALISLDFRMGTDAGNPFDVGASYEFADDIRKKGGHGDLWKATATWWANVNTGLTLEYSKGDTPVADEKVDLLKLGFEFKY